MAQYWKKVKVVITHDGLWTQISPRDQKWLLLLEKLYPWYFRTGRYRHSSLGISPKKDSGHDSGMSSRSDSDSETNSDRDEDDSGAAHIISQGSGDNEGRF